MNITLNINGNITNYCGATLLSVEKGREIFFRGKFENNAVEIPLNGECVEIEIKVNKRRLTSKQIGDLLDKIVTEEFVVNAINDFKVLEDKMEDKTQNVNSLEDLLKAANDFRKWAIDFGNELSKILANIQASKKEEDTWEMKCPYKHGDKYYYIQSSGDVFLGYYDGIEADNRYFSQGSTFPTKQAALLEAKRRNLLTRFKSFRDECNGDWKPDWKNAYENKYFICEVVSGLEVYVSSIGNSFVTFGYFKNNEDCERAIELFGDEIKELFVECD